MAVALRAIDMSSPGTGIRIRVPFKPVAVKFYCGWEKVSASYPPELDSGFSIGFACRDVPDTTFDAQAASGYGASQSFFLPWNDAGHAAGTGSALEIHPLQASGAGLGIQVTDWGVRSIEIEVESTGLTGLALAEVYGGGSLRAVIGSFVLPADGSTVSVSTLPFDGNEPLLVQTVAGYDGTGDSAYFTYGVLAADGDQWSHCYFAPWLASGGWSRSKSGIFTSGVPYAGDTVDWESAATLAADGFDVSNDVPPSADQTHWFLALYDDWPRAGCAAGFADDDITVSGLGFTPDVVGLGGWVDVDGVVDGSNHSGSSEPTPEAGCAAGTATRTGLHHSGGWHQNWGDAQRAGLTQPVDDIDEAIRVDRIGGGTALQRLEVTSIVPGGFSLLHSGRAFGWYALRTSPGGGAPQIYRRNP